MDKNNKRFYNLETSDREFATALRAYLKLKNFYYELSSAGEGVHFEVKLSKHELAQVNNWITCNA